MNVPAPRRRTLPRRRALVAALLAFPVLGALFWEHLPQGEVGGLPLLAALGSFALSGYAGHFLAGRAHFDGESLLQACAALSRCLLFAAPPPGDGTDASGEPPPPVLPLLSSCFPLYAGLGGWVYGLFRSREAIKSAGLPAYR